MKITQVYKQCRINKGLQEHMVRVAAVAKLICDNATVELPTKHIVDGCLVHDLGNLIKAKFGTAPELFDPEGVTYWQKVQAELIATYGDDVHGATIAMVSNIGLSEASYKYFIAIGGEATQRVHAHGELGEKIATYSDMRVGLHNIVSLGERMNDIRQRYYARNMAGFGGEEIDVREARLVDMENDIFAQSRLTPDAITDDTTASIQTELWDWELETE